MAGAIKPWRLVSSRYLVDDRGMKLRADDCLTAEGASVSPYYVIESVNWVSVLAITTDDNLVLVKQWRQATGCVTLELPGGEVEPDEDFLAAARRELAEEAGYGGGEASLVRELSPNTTRYSNLMAVVLMVGVSPSQSKGDTAAEVTETCLWPLSRADALLAHPEFINSPQVAALACAMAAWRGRERGESSANAVLRG
jgi:8-oxo-dGTP pyrophosphatase MutT (NUDIX family)